MNMTLKITYAAYISAFYIAYIVGRSKKHERIVMGYVV